MKFTYIADSCYSGAGARGRAVYRSVDTDGRTVRDPAPGEVLPKAPEERGFLMLSSSQADEQSLETTVTETLPDGTKKETTHGLFTLALVETLWQHPGESIDQVISEVRNLMAANPNAQNARVQEPGRGGKDRMRKDVFGGDPTAQAPYDSLVRLVRKRTSGAHGGIISNIYPGAILTRNGQGRQPNLRGDQLDALRIGGKRLAGFQYRRNSNQRRVQGYGMGSPSRRSDSGVPATGSGARVDRFGC